MLAVIESFILDIENGRMGSNPHKNANLRQRLYHLRDKCRKCEFCDHENCPCKERIQKALLDTLDSCDKCDKAS